MFGRPQLGISLGTLLGIFIWLLGSAAAPRWRWTARYRDSIRSAIA